MRRIYSFVFLVLFGMLLSLISGFDSKHRYDKPSKTDQKDKINLAAKADSESLDQRGGVIRGRVIYQGNPPQQKKLMVVKDVAVCGKINHYDQRLVVGADKGVKDAVISLINVEGSQSFGAMGSEFVLDQQGCTYQPHVLLVPVKTPVQILNNDGILHNIHTYSTKNRQVNLAQLPITKRLKKAFKVPEKVLVRCDLHGWMHSWIVVVEHPYHAVTDAQGKFTIPDIPPGTYVVQSWQEVLGEQTAEVTVVAGSPVTVDFKYRPKVLSKSRN